MWNHLTGQVETCDECRFDGSAYTDLDVAGTLRELVGWAGSTVSGLDRDVLNRRPAPDVWSPAEYLRHVKRVLWSMALLVESANVAAGAGAAPPPSIDGDPPPDATPDDPPADIEPLRELVRISEEGMRLHALWVGTTPEDQARSIVLNGSPADVAGIMRHAVHDATHHLSDIARGIAALGAGTPPTTGSVESVQGSSGVPKRHLDEASVGYRGVAGDRQETRRHHGRVWQALCLWSADVIDTLVAERHPVAPGAVGENVTLRGIDWATMRAGARIEFGEGGPLVETTDWTTPCSTIAHCFGDRDFRRIDVVDHPGSSRIYAKVLRDGTIRPGDAARVF